MEEIVAKSFTFSLGGRAPSAVVEKARSVATGKGAAFSGDEKAGGFSGSFVGQKFAGSYRIEGQRVIVTITDKPWTTPWFGVESLLRQFFQ
jgi:hypothetical protein